MRLSGTVCERACRAGPRSGECGPTAPLDAGSGRSFNAAGRMVWTASEAISVSSGQLVMTVRSGGGVNAVIGGSAPEYFST